MKSFSCAATRRRLDAFHDRELPIADEIAVSAHLDRCRECAAISADIKAVAAALRTLAPGRTALSNEDAAGFNVAMVTRLQAEHDQSFGTRLRLMFDDLHLLYVGVGATAAATVCLMVMMGMMRFATDSRPDSLAAILNVMATPFGCDASTSEIPDAMVCRARWVASFQRANETAEQDTVFTLDAVVIQEGQLANFAVMRASRYVTASDQAEAIEELLDSVSRARSSTEPTEISGEFVRIVAEETVRATKPAIDLPLPSAKPVASRMARARRVTA
jgi:predicted anti-sigma-YlaC factor YlaD